MDITEIIDHALGKSDVTEGFPFGENMLVLKTKNKIFLIVSMDSDPPQCNVKCDPEEAIRLREEYPDIIMPGYHMNKKHWNTIIPQKLKSTMVKDMIDNSYNLIR